MLFKGRIGARALRLPAGCALAGWVVGLVLLAASPWQYVELKLLDLMNVAAAPRRSALPITIVGIDETSFAQLGKRWPWPRDMHAQLIERLKASGAAVIAFDLLFPEKGTPEEDQAFAQAIRGAGNVVLAADYSFHETAFMRQWLRIDPVPAFTAAGAAAGLATVNVDEDGVIRTMPTQDDVFWRQTVRALLRARPGLLPEPFVAPGSLIHYLGPARTFPYVSYHQVLNGDPSIPKDFFNEQIVLVGKDVRVSLENSGSTADAFPTPFLQGSKMLTPGVEVQATILENALMGMTVAPVPAWRNAALLTLAMLASLPVLLFWHPLRSAALLLLLGAGIAGLSLGVYVYWHQWQLAGAPLAGLLAGYLAMGSGSYLTEKRRAEQIRSAFSKYVSADLVDKIVANPESLRLGGERRELTVLFTDLAGFTGISEKLRPEAVADLINLYLNEVTGVIMKHGGTVDKYVGDAVMAFWNAPLDDPQHALHATQAALEMQAVMRTLQPRFGALGAQGLAMRVGLHSGPAIVGNMGSSLRFDYTALGDTVNLASRLEGANKHYGTPILLSAASAAEVGDAIAMRVVDRVRVKGKRIPVDVVTPCDDRLLAQATAAAWSAYLARDWAAARECWSQVDSLSPGDPLAAIYLERIRRFETDPPPPDWDGSASLE